MHQRNKLATSQILQLLICHSAVLIKKFLKVIRNIIYNTGIIADISFIMLSNRTDYFFITDAVSAIIGTFRDKIKIFIIVRFFYNFCQNPTSVPL